MDYTLFVIQLLNGLQLGILLFLVASGLTLVFGILDFVNLAHGSVYMLGAFICASLTFALGNFVYALIISLPIVAVIGYGFERLIARPLYERDHLDHVLGTFGAILVIARVLHATGLKSDNLATIGRGLGAGGTALLTIVMSIWGIVEFFI